jgi:hypothetical protein
MSEVSMRRHDTHHRCLPIRSVTLVAAGALALTLAPPPAPAAASPTAATVQAQARLSVRPHRVHPGGQVLITGLIPTSGPQSCPAGDQAILTSSAALFPPDGIGPAVPRSSAGRFRLRYAVPTSTPPDTYTIGVRCGGGNVGVSATLRVV